MRIHKDFPATKHVGRGGPGVIEGGNQLTRAVLSRPKAHPQEVPARPRQRTQTGVSSLRPVHPQWMKTLEEKYRKLHLKIDSYPSTCPGGTQFSQHQVNGYRRFNSATKSPHKPLAALERPVDIVKLGKSVMRFSKGKRHSDHAVKTHRPSYVPSQSAKPNQGPNQGYLNADTVALPSSGAIRHDENVLMASHDPTDKKLYVSKATSDKIKHSQSNARPSLCDKQGEARADVDRGVDKLWGNNQDETTGSSLTDLQSNPLKASVIQEGTCDQDAPTWTVVSGYVDTLIETLARPYSPNLSCYSHPSTHRSSWRPKSSEAASESASYYLNRDRLRIPAGMPRPRHTRKRQETKAINVLLGMSEEARFAISETKKEMGSNSKCLQTDECDLNNGVVVNAEQISLGSENVLVSDGVLHKNPTEELKDSDYIKRENTLSSASMNTNIDDGSNPVNLSLNSVSQDGQSGHAPKLPELGRNGKTITASQGLNYLRVRQHNALSADKYGSLRILSREQTFQITPPDYDVRFREILTCDITDSETPPPDIKAQAVAKCSEWLSKRYVHNPKIGKENS